MKNKHTISVNSESIDQIKNNITRSSQLNKNKSYSTQEGVFDFFLEMAKMFILALVIIAPIKMFVLQPFIVRGISMEPNFEESQYLVVDEFGYKNTPIGLFGKTFFNIQPSKQFDRYDIVVFRAPNDKKEFYIKRVIGLPGETVEIENGVVTIYNNEYPEGRVLDESAYLPEGRKTNGSMKVTLADDEYYVLGDNRGHSSDSRMFGPRNEDDMIGKVVLRAWPIDQFNMSNF
jgi:signal peptidase I